MLAEGPDAHGRPCCRIRIEPRLSLLRHRHTSRIFQDQTLRTILTTILAEHHIPHAFALFGPQPERVYAVQHQENDLDFLTRICGEDGVFFWFDPRVNEETSDLVMFGDSASAYSHMVGDPTLTLSRTAEIGALTTSERHVTDFAWRRKSGPRGAHIRAYDFTRPAFELDAITGETDRLRVVYEDHERDERPEVGTPKAVSMLEQARAGLDVAEGASLCRRLAPGQRFALEDHDDGAASGGYVATWVEHAGHQPSLTGSRAPVYTARLRCVHDRVVVRPRRPRGTIRQVLETATVVGPPGEDVYTDEHGRIKVQFHWDLAGKKDDKTSCPPVPKHRNDR